MTAGNILVLALPIVLVIVLVRSQRRRTQQATSLQDQLAPGVTICTSSGLFGTVVSMTDSDFILEAAPGVHLRFDRRAIGLVVPSNQPPAEPDGHDDNA